MFDKVPLGGQKALPSETFHYRSDYDMEKRNLLLLQASGLMRLELLVLPQDGRTDRPQRHPPRVRGMTPATAGTKGAPTRLRLLSFYIGTDIMKYRIKMRQYSSQQHI